MKSAIEFSEVGKMYRLGRVGTGTLSHDLNRWWQTRILHHEDPYLKIGEINDRSVRGTSDYVWALKDISFKVEPGEVVGIIGKNGAGKSTLLKILSNITSPTTGCIRYNGRVASLLEVGTGFHPEMTGRENIYMNGSIMGMTRKEITRKLDAIVDFAGIERYLDTPVKRYSSGMTVRLGFAVAAFLEPEILVVDEVLAVGDAEFQKKAINKIQDVTESSGRTVLFVSHIMSAVKRICSRGIVLSDGSVTYDGPIQQCIDYYMHPLVMEGRKKIVDYVQNTSGFLSISCIKVNGSESNSVILMDDNNVLDIEVRGITLEPIIYDIMVLFKNLDGVPLASYCEGHYKGTLTKLPAGEFVIQRKIQLPHFLSCGDYFIDICMHHPSVCWYFEIRNSVRIHINGTTTEFGRALNSSTDGFFGLESFIE